MRQPSEDATGSPRRPTEWAGLENLEGRLLLSDITFFSDGITPGSLLSAVTAGPDGNLWFSEYGGDRVGRITTDGVVTEFPVGDGPGGLAVGSDGNIWFAELNANKIGRLTPAGVLTEFSAGISAGARPQSVTLGPDGNIWFAEVNGNRVGRITTDGTVTEFSVGITPGSSVADIVAGPDGNLWFTENQGRIGRITTAGVVTEFSTGITAGSWPAGITAGVDGALWFTETNAGQIGRITTSGVVTEFGGLAAGASPYDIATGSDGNLWITESGGLVARMTLAGAVTEFSGANNPAGIAPGPDGNVWFVEWAGGRVGVADVATLDAASASVGWVYYSDSLGRLVDWDFSGASANTDGVVVVPTGAGTSSDPNEGAAAFALEPGAEAHVQSVASGSLGLKVNQPIATPPVIGVEVSAIDWNTQPIYAADGTGETLAAAPTGADIDYVKAVYNVDSSVLHFQIVLADAPDSNVRYRVILDETLSGDGWDFGDYAVEITNSGAGWVATARVIDANEHEQNLPDAVTVVVNGSSIEIAVPTSAVGLPGPLNLIVETEGVGGVFNRRGLDQASAGLRGTGANSLLTATGLNAGTADQWTWAARFGSFVPAAGQQIASGVYFDSSATAFGEGEPGIGAQWFTGVYEGALYTNALVLAAWIDVDGATTGYEWSNEPDNGGGLFITGLDPAATVVDLKEEVTNAGQTATFYYRLNSDSTGVGGTDWVEFATHTLPVGVGSMTALAGQSPRLGLEAGYVDAGTSTASVSGTVFVDSDGSGTRDAGELPMQGAAVFLDANTNGRLDWTDANSSNTWDSGEGEQWVRTNGIGGYSLTGLPAGTYAVTLNMYGSPAQTVTLSDGEAGSADFAPVPTVVTFPDAGLQAAIRSAIGKPTGDIYDTDLVLLTSLSGGGLGITDLDGMEYCTNLVTLDVFGSSVSNLTPLQGLYGLTRLVLCYSQITDLTPIADLTALTELHLSENPIADISAISHLTNLVRLSLRGTGVSDISAISALSSLQDLYLDNSQVADLAALASLTQLSTLEVSNTQVRDLTDISGLSNLNQLRIGNDQIGDLTLLSGLNLMLLDVRGNRISDISPISTLVGLRTLWINDNRITDLSPLLDLPNLAMNGVNGIGNPLFPSAYTSVIPELQSRGGAATFDDPTTLGGTVYADADGSDTWDAGETGIAGARVYLDANTNGSLDWADANTNGTWDEGEGERWVSTDSLGQYAFDYLFPADHVVAVDLPGVTAKTVTLNAGDVVTDCDIAGPLLGSLTDVRVDRISDLGLAGTPADDMKVYQVIVTGTHLTGGHVAAPWGEVVNIADYLPANWDGLTTLEGGRGQLSFRATGDALAGTETLTLRWEFLTDAQWTASGTTAAALDIHYVGGGWNHTVLMRGLAVPTREPAPGGIYNRELLDTAPTVTWSKWSSPGAGSQIDVVLTPWYEDLLGEGTSIAQTVNSTATSWTPASSLDDGAYELNLRFARTDAATVGGATVTRYAAAQSKVDFESFGGATDDAGNGAATATPLAVPSTVAGSIDYLGDIDYYVFEAVKGRTYDILLHEGPDLDGMLMLYGMDGNTNLLFDDMDTVGARLVWTAPTSGAYYVAADCNWIDEEAFDGGYSLEINASDAVPDKPNAVFTSPITAIFGNGRVAFTVDENPTLRRGQFQQARFMSGRQVELTGLAPSFVGGVTVSQGGELGDWAATGDRFYLGDDVVAQSGVTYSQVVATDYTPGGPVEAWRLPVRHRDIDHVSVAGSLLLVGSQDQADPTHWDDNETAFLEIYDTSDPSVPAFLGEIDLSGVPGGPNMDVVDIVVSGGLAYLLHDDDSELLSVVDISDPAAPVLMAQPTVASTHWKMAVRGSTLFVEDGWSLVAYDMTNPAVPVVASTIALPGDPQWLQVEGAQIFIGIDQLGVQVYNVSDPTSPTLSGDFCVPGASGVFALTATTLYVPTFGANQMSIFTRGTTDLAPTVGAVVLPATAVPGDKGAVQVAVNNLGPDAVNGAAIVRVFASADAALDSGDVQIGVVTASLRLVAGAAADVNVAITIPAFLTPGNYRFIIELAPGTAHDSDIGNNVVAAGALHTVAWMFGQVGARTIRTLTVNDPDGSAVTFNIKGPGTGIAGLDGSGGLTLDISGATLATAITVTTRDRGGAADDGEAKFSSIHAINCSLGSFSTRTCELVGSVLIDGRLNSLLMDDVDAPSSLTIADAVDVLSSRRPYVGAAIRFDDVFDLDIDSAVRINSLMATQYVNDPALGLSIDAPSIGALTITGRGRVKNKPWRVVVGGDFSADVNLTDADCEGYSLGLALIAGRVYDSAVRARCDVAGFLCGAIEDSLLYAGVLPAVGDPLPTGSGDFSADHASIDYFWVAGLAGYEGRSFANSKVAAWAIGYATLRDVKTANGGTEFGLASGSPIEEYRRYVGKTMVEGWADLSGSLPPVGDFVVRIV